MSTYLERLKVVLSENTSRRGTDETDKSASVSFVSGHGGNVSKHKVAFSTVSRSTMARQGQNMRTLGQFG